MANLEGKLGELSGKIDMLVPTLADIGKKLDEDGNRISVLETQMADVRAALGRGRSRWWDLAKVVLAAALGAAATLLVGRLS